MKINYSIEKSETSENWVVWKNTETKRGCACKGIFSDKSRKKCYEYKKKIEIKESKKGDKKCKN